MATTASDRPILPAAMRSGYRIGMRPKTAWTHVQPIGKMLDPAFPNVPQPPKTNWCWAAVSVAVHSYLDGGRVTMCDLIDRVRPGFDCCHNPYSSACNAPTPVDQGLSELGNADRTDGALNMDQIQDAVGDGVPVVCVVSYARGNHAVVLIGWAMSSGIAKIAIMDPTAGVSGMPFTQFVAGYPAGGMWTESHFTRKAP